MLEAIKSAVNKCVGAFGYELTRRRYETLDAEIKAIVDAARPYTMTSDERISTVCEAVSYLQKRQLEGAFVECGVWRGGSSMAMALTLAHLGATDRDIYLYDTYDGMAEPTEHDRERHGAQRSAADLLAGHDKDDPVWACATLDDVRRNLATTGYPEDRLRFVKGKVEDTIPDVAPEKIALLRLDTDWYASTRHEMEQLYPRLVPGGVLIVDDYGHWDGARKAIDEYFATIDAPPMLHFVDPTGRIAIKDHD